MKKVIIFWLKSAKENFVTAKAMHKTGRWSFVFFMCQQTVEALLKAVYVKKKKEQHPFTHNLKLLLEKLEVAVPEDIEETILNLSAHYIAARYKTERFNSTIYNKQTATEILNNTEKVILWFLKEFKLKI